ncbi:MAG: flagellar motor switch protein FliN [Candidatus Delongbacteria bacterium]
MADSLTPALLELLRLNEEEFAGRAGEIFRTVINLETRFTLLSVESADQALLQARFNEELVCVEAPFVKGLPGSVVFLLEKSFTARVVDYMIMGDGEVEFMPEEHLDGIVEAVNQLMGNELTELSGKIGLSLRNEVRPARLVTPAELAATYAGHLLVELEVLIDGREPVRLWKLLSPDLSAKLADMLGNLDATDDGDDGFGLPPDHSVDRPAAAPAPAPPAAAAAPHGSPPPAAPAPPRDVRQAQFTEFGPQGPASRGPLEEKFNDRGLGRVLDLRLPVVIELGRTHMLIKDIVELSPGSVIELNKLVGEPVDLFVNGKRFAQGEVVVIDENFGVRVTELVPLEQRLRQAGEA